MHGSFTTNTYPGDDARQLILLGPVEGRSCQTRILYAFPTGRRASTDQAVKNAMSKIQGTIFLASMAIDDESFYGVGYSRRCVVVSATAYGRRDR